MLASVFKAPEKTPLVVDVGTGCTPKSNCPAKVQIFEEY